MNVAIFGGSFNPVHKEHINIAVSAINSLSLDKLIIMPSYSTPQKDGRLTASGQDRLEMCRKAFSGIACAKVSDYELKRGGVSYSYITCREFAKKYPDDERYFIVGADMLANFDKWKYPEDILQNVSLAACARENSGSFFAARDKFYSRFSKPVAEVGYVGKKVSSTRIRTLAALGEDVSAFTGEEIAQYITDRALYFIPEVAGVKKLLKPERWAHTVRVAVMAAEHCAEAGVSEKTAITAAALHDCAKNLSAGDELLKGFTPPDGVPESVMHQYSGAYVAENHFGITDTDIINAVRYHTSGRENMSALEKLIFLSDMLEEGRDYDGVEYLRKEFSRGLDCGMCGALERQIEYLEATGREIYPLTKAAINFFKEHKNDK